MLGGRNTETRGALGLSTAQRNIAAATVVATQAFEDPRPLIMAVITSLVAPFFFPLRRCCAGA